MKDGKKKKKKLPLNTVCVFDIRRWLKIQEVLYKNTHSGLTNQSLLKYRMLYIMKFIIWSFNYILGRLKKK